ncbi:MAG TPA: hypothetical protein VF883_02310 [Thermoanaerobaculia bacterium]|jgi:hypothetical protein
MRSIIATVVALTFASLAFAEEKGAKALFFDTTSGATIPSTAAKPEVQRTTNTGRKPVRAARKPATPPAVAAVPKPQPDVSGLMYYVELLSPNGEKRRVTTDRTFTSGERILLHVVSALDGDIAVYQRTLNGQAMRLFPDERIRDGSGRIEKGVDTALPSPTSWFRFDDRAGTEELTIVLTPRQESDPASATRPQEPQLASVRYDAIGPLGGSKSLVVETDREGPAPATYVVRRAVGGRPPEPVVVTVQLKHH